eukprot:7382098-Prymnesium_polylepis.3
MCTRARPGSNRTTFATFCQPSGLVRLDSAVRKPSCSASNPHAANAHGQSGKGCSSAGSADAMGVPTTVRSEGGSFATAREEAVGLFSASIIRA